MENIFLIAGEASGDALGSKLMAALKKAHLPLLSKSEHAGEPSLVPQSGLGSSSGLASPEGSESTTLPSPSFHGVGGERMRERGLESIFPMEELSLIGFVEIIPHIPKLLKRIDEVVEAILRLRPQLVVTIDAPAFNHRVIRKLREKLALPDYATYRPKLVHYVAPTVWAYKPHRAAKIAKLYDHLLVILPFEPPYFEKEGLPTTFIGHPIIEEKLEGGNSTAFRKNHGIPAEVPVLGVMPGSRSGELKRLLPVFTETIHQLKKHKPYLHVVVFATSRFSDRLRDATAQWPLPVTIVTGKHERKDALAACNVALAKSGTGTLEFALARVPMIVAYKVNPLSAWMLRRMLRVQHVNLVNLLLDKAVIPEYLQENCTAEKLCPALLDLLDHNDPRMTQALGMHAAMHKLLPPGGAQSSSDKAAEVLRSLLQE